MKFLLIHITILVLIDGGLSIECMDCEKRMNKNAGESDFIAMTEAEMQAAHVDYPCKDSDVENYVKCLDSQDTCLKVTFSYAKDDGNAAKTTEYRCDTDAIKNTRCDQVKAGAPSWGWNDLTCETEVIPSKEEAAAEESQEAPAGESQEERCKTEMCSGDEQPQVNFILAVASVVLYEIF